jgi:hypothetical protein
LEFDGFLLDRIEKEAGVDLADLSASGLLAVERDVKALVRVLVVACEDQRKNEGKTPAQFQKQIRKDAITRARVAVMEALADFFPASEWSAMESDLKTRKETMGSMAQMAELTPIFAALPEAVRAQLLEEGIAQAGNLQSSPGNGSAFDRADTPPTPVDGSQGNAESVPAVSPSATSG